MTAVPIQNNTRRTDAIFSLLRLDCSPSSEIGHKLARVRGIRNVKVDFVANSVLVSYDPDRISTQDIRRLIGQIASRD
jgi:hypothetical protein